MNYYFELEQEIETYLNQGQYDLALNKIETELSMPYVPMKLEEKLLAWQKECHQALNITPQQTMDFEVIKELLFDSNDMMVQAALTQLGQLNLRNHLDDLQTILNTHPNPLVSSMILYHLIEQEVDTELSFTKNGLDFEVNPRYIEHPTQSDGYQGASGRLTEMTFKEPSLNQLCQQLLVHEMLLALPLSYDELEAEGLAYSIYKQGLFLLNRESEWYNYTVEHNIDENTCLPLISTL